MKIRNTDLKMNRFIKFKVTSSTTANWPALFAVTPSILVCNEKSGSTNQFPLNNEKLTQGILV